MPDDPGQLDFFGERPAGGLRRAPADLTRPQWVALREWAESRVPWLSRGGLGATLSLEDYVEIVLDWGASNAKRKADWLACVRNWIRNDEFERVRFLPPDAGGRRALRDPAGWAADFDARASVVASALHEAPAETIRPAGATVFRLVPRSRG